MPSCSDLLSVVVLTLELFSVVNAILIPGLPGPPFIHQITELGNGLLLPPPICRHEYEIKIHRPRYDGMTGTDELDDGGDSILNKQLRYQVLMHVEAIKVQSTNSPSSDPNDGSFLTATQVDNTWIIPNTCYQVQIPPTVTDVDDIDQLITIHINTTIPGCGQLCPQAPTSATSSNSSAPAAYIPIRLQFGVAARNPYGLSTWHQRFITVNVVNPAVADSEKANVLSINTDQVSQHSNLPNNNNNNNNHVSLSIVLGVFIPLFILMMLGGGILYHRFQHLSKSTAKLFTSNTNNHNYDGHHPHGSHTIVPV